jgi:transposase InsO family protein
MRWVLMDIDSKRIDALAKHRMGWKVTDICESEGICRKTFYNWLERYNQYGQRGLVKKYAVLKENGLIIGLSRERKQRTYIRYQRKHPNSMWQTDLTNWKDHVVIAYIDDYSRFITGVGAFNNGITANVIEVFQDAIDAYGKPREVLTDHGTQFYAVNRDESEFDRLCASHRIKHILGSIGKPTTTGKIERWFGSLKTNIDNFRSVGDYMKYYNYEKPHKSLCYAVPAERYFEKSV